MNSAPNLGRWGNRLLATLPRETLAMLERDLTQVSLRQGVVCFDVGDQIDRVYFPSTGMISLLIATKDGNVVEAGAIGRGGAAGLQSALGERRSFTRATIQIPGIFTTISAVDFRRAASNNGLLRDLASRYTEVLWAESQQTAACNAIHDGSQRLCRWLLQSAIASEAITYRSRKNIWPICLACDVRPLRCLLRSCKNEVPSGTVAVR